MAIGNSYPIKPTVENYDLFLGTRNGTNNTVNYTAQAVVNYLNTSASIAVGGQLTFQFLINEYENKSMFFPGGGGDNTPFSSITQLLISNADCSGNETNIFLEYLEGTDILISEQNHANIFGHYKITGYAVTATPGFYTLDLEYIGANGNIQENVYYNINSFILIPNSSNPTLQQVTDAGNTTTNPLGVIDNVDPYETYIYPNSIITQNPSPGSGTAAILSADGYLSLNNGSRTSFLFNTNVTSDSVILQFPNKPSGTYTIATTADIPSAPTLQSVTNTGNTITNIDPGVMTETYSLSASGMEYAQEVPSGFNDSLAFSGYNYSFINFDTATYTDNSYTVPISGAGSYLGPNQLDLSRYEDTFGSWGVKLKVDEDPDIFYVNQNVDVFFRHLPGTVALLSDIPATVTSVGLSMPSAFTVTNSPVTSSGTLTVTGAGTVSQYVRGDGSLANFPNSTGGGSSVNYYLNGSVSQGTFGGVTYYEMSRTPILGAGTNFVRTNGAGNGYIASFITDAGDPSFLNIPGGNWNVEFYFQSSSPGSTPSFYAELYKVDVSNNFTLIASDSVNPEGITNGTTVDQYFSSIPVPQTTLLVTDRLAIRIFVNTAGRTITLHTENGNLCEVLTTFTTGLTALNGLTQQVQYFDEGTTGTDFNISSTTDTHIFNLPTASAANRGALSSTDWTTFNGKQDALGFTPANLAGDTFTGNIDAPSMSIGGTDIESLMIAYAVALG